MTPGSLRQVAAGLERHARDVEAALGPTRSAAAGGIWRGPAADRFDERLDALDLRLRHAAADLRAAARRLQRRAQEAEEEQRRSALQTAAGTSALSGVR